jgi:hypothetical protein
MNNFSWLIEGVIVESYPILFKHIIIFQNKYKYDVIDSNTIQKYFIWIQLTKKDINEIFLENYKGVSHCYCGEYDNFKSKCIDAGILFNESEIIIRFYLYKFAKKYSHIKIG